MKYMLNSVALTSWAGASVEEFPRTRTTSDGAEPTMS